MAAPTRHASGDHDALRRRYEREIAAAYERGRDEAVAALVDLVDDCDRALASLAAVSAPAQWCLGVEQLRNRALTRFEQLGYVSFMPLGEQFDPNLHEAVAVDQSPGPHGQITAVHRRGWLRNDKVVLAATVTVRQGEGEADLPVATTDSVMQVVTGRRRRRPLRSLSYICPHGVAGCVGDCEGCRQTRERRS